MNKKNLQEVSCACVGMAFLLLGVCRPIAAGRLPSKRMKSAVQVRAAAASSASLYSNDYIEIAMEHDGYFTIGTKAGDPSSSADDNAALLFGHPSPGTSDTMIKIDGVAASIHAGGPATVISAANSVGGSLEITLPISIGTIVERLTIQNSLTTGLPNAVLIYFKVTNTDSSAHNIQLRTQLDTLLGRNDGAPFRVPGVGEVTKDKEFLGSDVPTNPKSFRSCFSRARDTRSPTASSWVTGRRRPEATAIRSIPPDPLSITMATEL